MTTWTTIPKASGGSGGGTPIGMLLALTYASGGGGSIWTTITKASGTSWTTIPKAT